MKRTRVAPEDFELLEQLKARTLAVPPTTDADDECIHLCDRHAGDGEIGAFHDIIYFNKDSCTWHEYPRDVIQAREDTSRRPTRTCFTCGKQLVDSWSEGTVFHEPGCGHYEHKKRACDENGEIEEFIFLCPGVTDSNGNPLEGCVDEFENSFWCPSPCTAMWMQSTGDTTAQPPKKLKA